jgi:murein DD-endopeptidase MepM/ murein hydrolase activator NlpD
MLAAPAVVLLLPLAMGASALGGAAAGQPAHPDIPPPALRAYVAAAAAAAAAAPPCALDWTLLAGIGAVETDHGRFGGSAPAADGRVQPPILGVRLDGSTPGTAVVADTDGGRLDGDPAVDRAVGPMQFLPGTWARAAADADGDGVADPHDLDDAAAAAAALLCAAGGGDLTAEADRRRALRAYNRSTAYADEVLAVAARYAAEATAGAAAAGADAGGAVACPVARDVAFTDTWHAPRSGGRRHKGQDLFAPEGTPLVALADGVVTELRTGAGLGGTVLWLAAADGAHWYYAHLDAFAPGLRAGDRVTRGQVVGTVGRTGNAATTPAHLHIQWRPSGRDGPDVNPYPLLDAACPR